MKYRLLTGASLAAALLFCSAGAAAELKSGPQVGEGINGKFIVHGLNASLGGKNYCPV